VLTTIIVSPYVEHCFTFDDQRGGHWTGEQDMTLDALWQQMVVGLLGGVAAEILHWYQLAHKPGGASSFAQSPVYWVATVGMIVLGAAMPLLYLGGSATALLCFHLGAATPILLQKLVAATPAVAQPQGASRATFRDFLTW
jgi:hypothetical protein